MSYPQLDGLGPLGGLVLLTLDSSEVRLQLVSKSTLAVACISYSSTQPRHAYCCGAMLPLSGGASGPGVLAAAFLAARVARLLATAGDIDPDAHRACGWSARVDDKRTRQSPGRGVCRAAQRVLTFHGVRHLLRLGHRAVVPVGVKRTCLAIVAWCETVAIPLRWNRIFVGSHAEGVARRSVGGR